jgi:hypothetical protein
LELEIENYHQDNLSIKQLYQLELEIENYHQDNLSIKQLYSSFLNYGVNILE